MTRDRLPAIVFCLVVMAIEAAVLGAFLRAVLT